MCIWNAQQAPRAQDVIISFATRLGLSDATPILLGLITLFTSVKSPCNIMESYDEVDLESLDIEEVKDIVYRLRYQQVTRDVVPAAKRHAIESRLRYCAAQPPAFILSNVLLFVHLDGQDDYLAALRIILQVSSFRIKRLLY